LPSTIPLSRTTNLASLAIGQRPLTGVGGFANEPALSIGDWVRNFLLSPPFAWRWNRNVIQFVTEVGVQDYTFAANWLPVHAYGQYSLVSDSLNDAQQATNAGVSGASTPAWSSVTGQTTTDGSIIWVHTGGEGMANGLADFGWIEIASVNDGNIIFEMEVALELGTTLVQELPTKIAARLDDGTGSISFRLFPAPLTIYTVNVSYQRACPTFAALTDFWYPIPDFFSYLYNTGFLAKTYEYAGDEKFAATMQLFIRQIVAANEGLTATQKDLALDHALIALRETQAVQRGGG
jgi:hypothetical protein